VTASGESLVPGRGEGDDDAIRTKEATVTAFSRLRSFLRRESLLVEQRRELAAMRDELSKQQVQNERMRAGMRRCLTCDYRREVIGQRAAAEQGEVLDPDMKS